MKLIMENWRNFVNEEANEKIKQIAANLEKYNNQMVNEEVEELNEVSGAAAAALVAFMASTGGQALNTAGDATVSVGGKSLEISQQDLEATANKIDTYAARVDRGGEIIGQGAEPEDLIQTWEAFLTPQYWSPGPDDEITHDRGLPTFDSGRLTVGQVDDAVLGDWVASADAQGQAQAQDAAPGTQVQQFSGGNAKLAAYHALGQLAANPQHAGAKSTLEKVKNSVPALQGLNFNTITQEETSDLLNTMALEFEQTGEPEPATGASGDGGPETEKPVHPLVQKRRDIEQRLGAKRQNN